MNEVRNERNELPSSDWFSTNMQTNKTISKDSELAEKGQALIKAAYEYWQVYQRECGSSAVVWLDDTIGHFVLFTRSEYKDSIMASAMRDMRGEPKLFEPFENTENSHRETSETVD